MPRILVADDNTNIQKMVLLAFQERGIEVIAVGNGEAAVRRVPDANPDLVLADVFMPVRNGYEVCEFIKKDTRYSHIPVILLVGAFDPLDEKEARRVGADGVLKKPFVPPDPLIAMVMSALEKNPKVVAELARAKEAKEAAAAVTTLPAAALENPAMAEVKPLPEFPEPSPEEAAMIYGFGKGVRAIDGEEPEEDEEESSSKKSKSAKSLKDPQESKKKSKTPAVAAPKTPVVAMEEDDEEFDSSVTASDWRRNAADLEVPDNVEANPIYSYGKNFEPITFPSERDVPPKRVRPEDEPEAAASEEVVSATAPAEVTSRAIPEGNAGPADVSSRWELTTETELETEHSTVDAASPLASADVKEVPNAPVADEHVSSHVSEPEVAAPVLASANVAEREEATFPTKISSEVTPPEPREAARPSFVARVRGWMDMMSPSSDEPAEAVAESRDQHWMTSLASAPATSSEPLETQSADVPAPLLASDIENPVKMAEAESLAEDAAAPAVVESNEASHSGPVGYEVPTESRYEEQVVSSPVAQIDETREEESSTGASEFSSSTHDSDSAWDRDRVSEAEEVEKTEAAPETSVEKEALPQVSVEAPHEPLHEHAPETWTDLLAGSKEAERNGDKVTEHLPLEPMISELHEQPAAASDFAADPEHEPSHVTEWLRHRANQIDERADESLPSDSSLPESTRDTWPQHHVEAGADHKPFADQPEPSIFEREPAHAFAEEFVERVPTLPPPNREALSQIPFLMPNAEPEPVTSDSMNASNSATVDEVVRRVLEKLQPQLSELLSQGVKPLVENMLQNELKAELHKNEK